MIRELFARFGLIGVIPVAAIATFIVMLAGMVSVTMSRPAVALPQYASQTGQPCGRCHVNAAGGGPRTKFGQAFATNGHKLPGKK